MSRESASGIRELDTETIERIAAGEVVERPASAVKELVENSLDADASRIDVTVDAGGTEGIVVADDGVGMTESDLRRAVKRHTTSKIRDVSDLETGVGTLGFRGEALAAIGAVAHLTVTSRPRTGSDRATQLRIEGGSVVDVAPAGRGPGTTVEVTDLFYNVPARREFLKAESTEFRHVNRVVTRYALANPGVAVSLTHDGREIFATPGDGDRRSVILAVYGRPVAEAMVDVEATPTGPVDGLEGLVSDAETTRASRSYVSTFVNGRYVEEAGLRQAIVDAYGDQLAADRFPFAALFLSCPPATVDPNVHPRKLRVRFEDEDAVRECVESAVREALLESGEIRQGAPRGASAPTETPVDPGTDDDDVEPTQRSDERSAGVPNSEYPDRGDNAGPWTGGSGEDAAYSGTVGGKESEMEDRELEDRVDPCRAGGRGADDVSPRGRTVAATGRDATLGDAQRPGKMELTALPSMTVLGQIDDTYLVAETADGLVLIDQHAADERVNYERLLDRVGDRPDSQALVVPVELDLTAAEAASMRDVLSDLRTMGFDASLEDDRTAIVRAVPSVLGETLEPSLLREVLADVLFGAPRDQVESAAEAILADLACYPSVTANTALSSGSVVELLEALDTCENPYACPHGRPTMVAIDRSEIDDRFERDYPGHQVRRPEDDGVE